MELLGLEYWYRKDDEKSNEKIWYLLNRALGTLWEKKDFEVQKSQGPKEFKAKDRIFYPLSVMLAQNNIMDIVRRDFEPKSSIGGGDYTPTDGEQIQDLTAATSKEQFLDWIKGFAGVGTPLDLSESKKG